MKHQYLHQIASTLTLICRPIPPNRPTLSSPPPQTVTINWLLPWMGGTAIAFCCCWPPRLLSHHHRTIPAIQSRHHHRRHQQYCRRHHHGNCLGRSCHHCHHQWRSVVIDGDRDIRHRHSARFIIIFIIHIVHRFVSRFCVPWQPIGGIGSNQGTAALTMMYGWSGCPWMCQTGANCVNTTTSISVMSSCRKYHGCELLW